MELESLNITSTKPEPSGSSHTQEWAKYKEETGKDFILEYAEKNLERAGEDPEIRQGVYSAVIEMVMEYKKSAVRDYYIQVLGRRYKPAKHWKDEFKEQCEQEKEERETAGAPGDDADTSTLEKFGFYQEDNKYFFANAQGFTEGTNFVIEPLFHIYSPTNNKRLIRVVNEYGVSMLCDVPSDAMVSVEKFQSFLYSEGNYIIFINSNQFKKLLRYIGEKFPKCYEIRTFGWQPEGFFAFADGIYNERWQPVNEMGITQHNGKNYFSPAFSEVYSELRLDDDVYENDRRFVYRTSSITVKEWSKLVQRVYAYAGNGQYAVAYLAAALFRSVIYNLYKIFPHLFLHGEKGSGKSQVGWSLSNVFQWGTPPFNLSAGTDVAFFRWLARYRDVVIWYDEYTDSIDEKRFQALKSAYDGVGREKGKMSRDSRTESDKINSAAVISGQHLPQRDDNSLYTRSIVRFFVKPKDGMYSREETQMYETLKRMEEEGLSHIITSMLNQRKTVEKKFGRIFQEIFEQYKEQLIGEKKQVDERILRNYTILAAIVWIFERETPVSLAINAELFRKQCFEDAIEQSEKVSSSDALGTFWKIVGGLIQDGSITRMDYDIQHKWSETKVSKESGDKKLTEVSFEKENEKGEAAATRVLYLDFDRVYQKYMEQHRRIFGAPGLGLQTMMDYSHNHWSYVGLKASHYFEGGNGKRTSAHMYNYDLLVEKGTLADINEVVMKEEDKSDGKKREGDENGVGNSGLERDNKLPF